MASDASNATDYAGMTPAEVDTLLVEHGFQSMKCEQIVEAHTKSITECEEKIRVYSDPTFQQDDPAYWERTIKRYQDRLDFSRAQVAEMAPKLAEHDAIVRECDQEYSRRPWKRYFLTQNSNGHLHSSTRCTTLYDSTVLALIPSVSGFTTEQIWEAVGEVACDVCFKNSPFLHAKPKIRLELPEKQRLREKREAARAEREAKKNAKSITNPDGSVLKLSGRYGEKIRTEAEAQRVLVNNLTDFLAVEAGKYTIHNEEMIAERHADNALLVTALAHKRGLSEEAVLEDVNKKAAAKYKREWK
jgi:NTP pyrophosphatase (non-canonical NTP hydrolase)